MPQKAQDSTASRELTRHLEKGATGRISVGSGPDEVAVYVQVGAILAAETPNDAAMYVRRLRAEGAVTEQRAGELLAMVGDGEPIFGTLIDEISNDVLDRVLQDRFIDNVAAFMRHQEAPRFEFTAGVFVDNLQMGLDAAVVMLDAGAILDAARAVPSGLFLERGPARPRIQREARLLRLLGDGDSLEELVPRLPLEPIAGRALVATMLAAGMLKVRRAIPDHADPDDVDVSEPTADLEPDEDTEMVSQPDQVEEVIEPVVAVPSTRLTPRPLSEPDDEYEEAFSDEDDFANEPADDDGIPNLAVTGEHQPPNVSKWMEGNADVEDDLDAFADFEEGGGRGGSNEAGAFSTEQHNLERVEVGDIGPLVQEDEEPEEVEAGDIPQAKFGAPTLLDEEAYEKVEAANESLMKIIATFDAEQGSGAGRAALQILVDGSPAKYSALFDDVVADEDGTLPARVLVRNLHQRPSSEHRALMTDGLVDLVERALSIAADELSDDGVDSMLEQVAGYRQRIGR